MAIAARSRRRHHRSGGLLERLLPTLPEAVSTASAGAYGYLERQAAADKDAILNKVPTPLSHVGQVGNLGIFGWAAATALRSKIARSAALGLVNIASYQMLRRTTPATADAPQFALSGLTAYGMGARPALRSARSAQAVEAMLSDDDDSPDDDDIIDI